MKEESTTNVDGIIKSGGWVELKEYFNRWIDGHESFLSERDCRYEQRFAGQDEAVKAALVAAKEQTTAAFAASEKAIVKAEAAQGAYNLSHNDLIRKMESMIPRTEFDGRFKSADEKIDDIKKEIAGLRESRSEGAGGKTTHQAERLQANWQIGIGLAAAGFFIALAQLALKLLER